MQNHLALLLACLALSGGAAADARMPDMSQGPFSQPSSLPYQFPQFDRISDADYRPAFEAGMREQIREVQRIAHNQAPADFQNTLVALERYRIEFIRAGARLSPADQERLRTINGQLSSLTTQFRQNVLEATRQSAVVVDNVADLEGFTPEEIGAAAAAAAARNLPGKWVITLQNTTTQPALAQLKNRAVRERIYRASTTRGLQGGQGPDNTGVISQIVRLRGARGSARLPKSCGVPTRGRVSRHTRSGARASDATRGTRPGARPAGRRRSAEAHRRGGRGEPHGVVHSAAVGLG